MLVFLEDLGVRSNGVRNYRWASYLCPKCNKVIERMKHQGDNQKQCQDCFREHHRKTQIKHGGRYTRLYRTWINMRARCNNSKDKKFEKYGGRGITICEEWSDFANFREWANSSGYDDNLTIDRIDVDGDYTPENCQWLTNSYNAKKDKHKRVGMKHKLSISEDVFFEIESRREFEGIGKILKELSISDTAYRNAKKRYT